MRRRGTVSTAVFLVILGTWPVLTVLTMPKGTPAEQAAAAAARPNLHRLNFSAALLIAPAYLWMIRDFAESSGAPSLRRTPPDRTGAPEPPAAESAGRGRTDSVPRPGTRSRAAAGVAAALYLGYLVLVSLSYGAQVVIAPLPESWFFYNPDSTAIAVNQSGYLLWSLATLTLFGGELRRIAGFARAAAAVLLLSALLQTAATAGFYAGIDALAGLSFAAGLLLWPAGLLILIHQIRRRP